MNFLAHAYLSFGEDEIVVGNLIADLVKGKQIESFPQRIQDGIMLHRRIDEFTDRHPVVKEAKTVFTPSVGRYDNSFLDVAFDHFLALDYPLEMQMDWSSYASECYKAVEKYGEILPPKFCSMFMYMRSEDWLSNYHNLWMIERSFDRLKRRAKYLQEDVSPFTDFENNYDSLKNYFNLFFPDVEEFVKDNFALDYQARIV